MTPQAKGLLWALFGAAMIGATWYLARTDGRYLELCLAGPAVLIFGIGTLALPPEKLYKGQHVTEGEVTKYVYDENKLSWLSWLNLLIGLALGGLQFAALELGWFL